MCVSYLPAHHEGLHSRTLQSKLFFSFTDPPPFPSPPPPVPSPNHQRWYAKWKLSWNLHTLHAHFFCTFGANLYAQSVLIDKISASELSLKFIMGALLVGQVSYGSLQVF